MKTKLPLTETVFFVLNVKSRTWFEKLSEKNKTSHLWYTRIIF